VRVWDLATGLESAVLRGHAAPVWGVAFRKDGRQLASGSEDRTVRIWDAATGRETLVLRGHTDVVRSVAFHPAGTHLASASVDRTVKLWTLPEGKEHLTLRGHTGPVWCVAYHPDGDLLASTGVDRTVRLWDAGTGKEMRALRGHTAGVIGLAFSPDGRSLASAGQDRTVRLWDTATGRETLVLAGPDAFWCVAFSPDGARLAGCAGDQVILWDLHTGQEVQVLRGPLTQRFFTVAFSPDGRRLAATGNQSNSAEQSILLWDATPPTPALLDDREARGIVSFWSAQSLPKDRMIARIRGDAGLSERVRQRALDLVGPYEQYRIRSKAEDVVRLLFSKPLLRPEVRASLQADATLEEAVRREALDLADRYVEGAFMLNMASRDVVRRAGAAPAAYTLALRQAERACQLIPHEGSYHTTLGMALYRVGKYREALAALTKAGKINTAGGGEPVPADLAFLVMVQIDLGQREAALVTLERLREVMKKPAWSGKEEATGWAREAEERVKAKAGS
jgi:hypothetical protein